MDLHHLRVKDLQEICKKFGIRTGGRKAELIERIEGDAAYKRSLKKSSTPGGNKRRAPSATETPTNGKKHKREPKAAHAAIHALFDQFQDPESPDAITDDGILALCEQLGVDPQDPVMLVLSWYMNAEAMCTYTRDEFVRGLDKLECQSLEDIRKKLPNLRRMLHQREDFVPIYLYTFTFAKDPTQKSLALEIALGLWEILLPGYFPLRKHWLRFVKTNCRNSISRDVWMQVVEFGHQVAADLSNFDENGAWPVLLDDFVSHMREEMARRGVENVLKEEADDDAIMDEE